MNYRLSFRIVHTVLELLFRQVRIPYLSKTAKTKPTLQENGPINSFRFDVTRTQRQHCTLPLRNLPPSNSSRIDMSRHITATPYSSKQQPTFF